MLQIPEACEKGSVHLISHRLQGEACTEPPCYLKAMLPSVVFVVTVQLFYCHIIHKRFKYFMKKKERNRSTNVTVSTQV
jgi:hypothetical protein